MKLPRISTAVLTLCTLSAALAGGCAAEMSADQLAKTVGQPHDVQFFGDRALYMGDMDGYRYVHVRDMFDCTTFIGECTYKVPQSQWPMAHPMPLTCDASLWQDVQWMNSDGPPAVPQSGFLHMTPVFPIGAPATQPAMIPNTTNFSSDTAPSTQPSTQP